MSTNRHLRQANQLVPYREVQVEYDSDDGWDGEPINSNQTHTQIETIMYASQVQPFSSVQCCGNPDKRVETPQIKTYQKISVKLYIRCDIPLDILKSIADFDDTQDEYVAWRQSATDAYELFTPFSGINARS